MISLLFFVGIILIFYLGFFGHILSKRYSDDKFKGHLNPDVSILIVARDEEENIGKLILSLQNLDYPPENYEILFFDDNSTDATLETARSEFQKLRCKVQVFSGSELGIIGKKSGLALLAENAMHEVLLFTDADVIVPIRWIKSMVDSLSKKDCKMVCAPVAFTPHCSLFNKLMVVEFAAMVTSSLLAIERRLPFMCNAANMMIYKSDYKLYSEKNKTIISSGDDVYLLKAIKEVYGASAIRSNFSECVYTEAPVTFNVFVNQRIRWAGKTSKLFFANSFFVGLLVFFMALAILLTLFLAIATSNYLPFLMIFLCKWMVDLLVLKRHADLFGLFKGWGFYSLMLSIIYPIYIVSIALLSLKPRYLWKGRMVN